MNYLRLKEIAILFLKLGLISFGGPAAHIALMEDEFVNRRQWLTREHFLDLLGATNLIPGPNSTEMAIHIGYSYGGFLGLIIAGICFTLPAVIITGILAAIYLQFGDLPQIAPLLYGIKPAVLVVILDALWRLGKKAVKSRELLLIGLGVAVLLFLGINELIALLLGGVLGMIWLVTRANQSLQMLTTAVVLQGAIATQTEPTNLVTPSLAELGLFFLKVGSVLFGGGYVLIAFLEGELVGQYHWLTKPQLLDAIAIGQFTPGPVLSTATFIGYLILGIPGAIVATLGIFLPSFVFVAALNPLVPKMRKSKWTAAFLDAVNVSSVALMLVVTITLAQATLFQPFDLVAMAIALSAGFVLFRYRLNTAWIVLGAAVIGWLISILSQLISG